MSHNLYLDLNHPKAEALLWDHSHLVNDKMFRALPVDVVGTRVMFKLAPETSFSKKSKLSLMFKVLQLKGWLSVILPCISVFFLLYVLDQKINVWQWGVASIAALFVFVFSKLRSDVSDYLALIDLPGTLGAQGVLPLGLIKAKHVYFLSWIFLVIGLGLAFLVLVHQPLYIIALSLVVGVVTFVFSVKKHGLKYGILGDLVVFMLFGPLLSFGLEVVSSGKASVLSVLLGLGFGLATAASYHFRNMKDIPFDASRGIVTLATKLGFVRSRHLLAGYYFFSLSSFLLMGLFFQLGYGALMPLSFYAVFVLLRLIRVYEASGPYSPRLTIYN